MGGPGTIIFANPRKTQKAARFIKPPEIDGDLSDDVWRKAPRYTGFSLLSLELPTYINNQTMVQVGWDRDYVYIAATCFENYMDRLKTDAVKHDDTVYMDDSVELFLAPPIGNEEYYQIVINSEGTVYDGKGYDFKWSSGIKVKTSLARDRWFVEMAVPVKNLNWKTAEEGQLWRWHLARSRVAGGGKEAVSSIAEMTGSYHTYKQFDRLKFVSRVDAVAEEEQAHRNFFKETRSQLNKRLMECDSEFLVADGILKRAPGGDPAAEERRLLEALAEDYRKLADNPAATMEEYLGCRSSFQVFNDLLRTFAHKVNRIGFRSAGALPADLKQGVTRAGDFYFLRRDDITVAVDAESGVIAGIYDPRKRQILEYSHEIYMLETENDRYKSDERLDKVTGAEVSASALVLNCKNALIPGTVFRKTYVIKDIKGRGRALSRTISIQGKAREKTLLSLVSRTCFKEEFVGEAVYHRVKPTGTSGDPRSVFRAADIDQPIMLHYLFIYGAAANLCAVDGGGGYGLGQHWLSADGHWVLPRGYEGNKSFFTDKGWDLGWFCMFLNGSEHSAEMRYHLFKGDRTVYHQEYRDLPERRKVMEAEPISPRAKQNIYNLTFGSGQGNYSFKENDPNSKLWQEVSFLYDRMRSREVSTSYTWWGVIDLRYGDYPVGDDALLHLEIGRDSKNTLPAVQVKNATRWGAEHYPRILSGAYYFPHVICKYSVMAEEHPEYFRYGKNNVPVPAISDHPEEYVMADLSKEYLDVVLEKLLAQTDYYGRGSIYLDFSIEGPVVCWGDETVRYSKETYDFLNELSREMHKRDKIMFLNSETFNGIWDLGYFEGFNKYTSHGSTWRDYADSFLMGDIYGRPGQQKTLLYWFAGDMHGDNRNYRDYTNAIMSHLLMTNNCYYDPYHEHFKDPETGGTDWAGVQKHTVAYRETMLEASEAWWMDLDALPCWRRDEKTDTEVVTYAQGEARILTLLRHVPAGSGKADVPLSAAIEAMRFDPDRPVFVWHYTPRDPDSFPRKPGKQPENWDRLFVSRDFSLKKPGTFGKRLDMGFKGVDAFLTHLVSASQVPAAFCSLEGRETNLLLPALLDCSIEGELDPSFSQYELKVESVYPAEILAWKPAGFSEVLVNGRAAQAKAVRVGGADFLRLSVPVGSSRIVVRSRGSMI